jgi:hypothetical protein
MLALRYFDIVLLILALPVFLVAGLPMAGYAAAAGVWIVQRAIQVWSNHKAASMDDPRKVAGIAVGSMIGRGWLVALTILAVGLADSDEAGLAAAVLLLVLVTAYLTVSMIMRPFENHKPEQPV